MRDPFEPVSTFQLKHHSNKLWVLFSILVFVMAACALVSSYRRPVGLIPLHHMEPQLYLRDREELPKVKVPNKR